MLCNGTDHVSSTRPSSRAFARPSRRPDLSRFLAALPMVLVAGFTFNAAAPAGITPEDNVVAVAPQAEGRWSVGQAKDLLDMVEASEEEGLYPADYNVEALRAAVNARQQGPGLDALATASALRLAHDYADGRIDDKERFDWHIAPPTDVNALATGLNDALDRDRLARRRCGADGGAISAPPHPDLQTLAGGLRAQR